MLYFYFIVSLHPGARIRCFCSPRPPSSAPVVWCCLLKALLRRCAVSNGALWYSCCNAPCGTLAAMLPVVPLLQRSRHRRANRTRPNTLLHSACSCAHAGAQEIILLPPPARATQLSHGRPLASRRVSALSALGSDRHTSIFWEPRRATRTACHTCHLFGCSSAIHTFIHSRRKQGGRADSRCASFFPLSPSSRTRTDADAQPSLSSPDTDARRYHAPSHDCNRHRQYQLIPSRYSLCMSSGGTDVGTRCMSSRVLRERARPAPPAGTASLRPPWHWCGIAAAITTIAFATICTIDPPPFRCRRSRAAAVSPPPRAHATPQAARHASGHCCAAARYSVHILHCSHLPSHIPSHPPSHHTSLHAYALRPPPAPPPVPPPRYRTPPRGARGRAATPEQRSSIVKYYSRVGSHSHALLREPQEDVSQKSLIEEY